MNQLLWLKVRQCLRNMEYGTWEYGNLSQVGNITNIIASQHHNISINKYLREMLTKTKGLIMSRMQAQPRTGLPPQQEEPRQQPHHVNQPIRLSKRQPSLRSNVLQHNIFCIVNKKAQPTTSSQELKQLEREHLRLLEEKVLLTEWTHGVMNKIREGIVRAVRSIEEFRYLQGVNLLHGFLAQMAQFDPFLPQLPKRIAPIEESRYTVEHSNPESKNTLFMGPPKLQLCRLVLKQTHTPKKIEVLNRDSSRLIFANQKLQSPSQSPFRAGDEDYQRMLLLQSMSVEYLVGRQAVFE